MQQPMTQQISQPLAIFYVCFMSRQGFDVLRVDQQQRTPLFQHIEDWAPEHSRAFHRHMRDALEAQPVIQP
jgi:hypothetical protein